jgi:hypothetical protein
VQLYVLHNADEVESFVEIHKDVLRSSNPNKNENWIGQEHNRSFIAWFKNHIYSKLSADPASISEKFKWLAHGPSSHIFFLTLVMQLTATHFIPKNMMMKAPCKIVVSP